MTSERIDDDDRTTAIGLSRYAYEYLEAAILVDDEIGQRPGYEIVAPIPALYLVGHAIELPPHVAEEGALELLSELYSSKELNYIRTGVKHFPSFALVKSLAVALHNVVGPHVGFNTIFPLALQHQ